MNAPVNKILHRLVLSSLIAVPLAHAADPVVDHDPRETAPAPAKPEKPAVQLLLATMSMAQEIDDVINDSPDLGRNLEKLTTFQHSPKTAELLKEAMGNPQPWRFERTGADKAGTRYRFSFPAHRHELGDGGVLNWREMPVDMTLDARGRLDYRGTWSGMLAEKGETTMSLQGMTLSGKQRIGKGNVWYGPMSAQIADVTLNAPDKSGEMFAVKLSDLGFDSDVIEKPKAVDIALRLKVGSIALAGEELKNVTMAYRLTNIDKTSLESMVALQRKAKATADVDKLDIDAMLKEMGQFVRAAAKANTAIVIDRIGAEFGGYAFTLKGRIGMRGVKDSDFDALPMLMTRIDARFDLALPLGMVKAISLSVARQQQRKNGAPETGPEVEAMAKNMADMVIGRMTADGYARLDKGVLRSTVVLREGKLTVNGKPVKLPSPKVPAKSDDAAVVAPRRDETSCVLPAYPAQVIADDAPLLVTVSLLVHADGDIGSPVVEYGSAWPEFDAALSEALAECDYVPGRANGKPVDDTIKMMFKREQGSTRPE